MYVVRSCVFGLTVRPMRFFVESGAETYALGSNHSKYLSTEVTEGFTGVMFALYAQGAQTNEGVVFEDFCCQYEVPEVE